MAEEEEKTRARTYTCWDCHRPGFEAQELVSHRCVNCRMNRMETTMGNPKRGTTPWVASGQEAWVRFDGLGPDGGVYFRKRKRPITRAAGAERIKKLNRLPTWKNGSRS